MAILNGAGNAQAKSRRFRPRSLPIWNYGGACNEFDLGPYVPLTMRCDQAEIDLRGIVDQLARNPNLQVIGLSGSGKTHLLTHLALTLSEQGFLPVTTRAGHFTGHLAALLNQAIASATTMSFAQLSDLSAAAGLRPVIIVDAINECPPNLRTDLIKALQELRIRFHAPIVTSGQTEISLPGTLAGPTVKIDLPDLAQKRQLVEAYLSKELPKDADFALNLIIASAQDAKVWAEVFEHSDLASSRYTLYASFVRRRLGPGPEAAIAYRALGKLATEMREQFVFSIPEATATTTIARVIGGHALEGLVDRIIKNSGLLHVTAGRAAFRHELLQNFFAAEDLLLKADALHNEFAKPVNAELAEFVIGGLAGARDIEQALGRIRSLNLLSACLSGRCGALARRTVEDRCRSAIERLGARITAASFDFAAVGREQRRLSPITIDMSSCPQLQQHDQIYIEAAVMVALDGQLDNLLALFSRIDNWIEGEHQRLRGRYPHKKIAWRAPMFTAIYCHPIDCYASVVQQLVQARKSRQIVAQGRGWLSPSCTYPCKSYDP